MGLIPAPYSALYASSKHAVEGYSESLDDEVRRSGVRVVLVEPADTRTRAPQTTCSSKRHHLLIGSCGAQSTLRSSYAT